MEPESARDPRLMQEYKSYRKLEKEDMREPPAPPLRFTALQGVASISQSFEGVCCVLPVTCGID